MTQDHWRRIKNARQRIVLCRLMIEIMRTVHSAYAPANENFGTRLETFFVGLCVALGDMDGKPFSVAKIAAYLRVPRTTAMRRLNRLQSWGLINRQGRYYYANERTLNSLIGMRSYQQARRFLSKATEELTVLDTLLD
jgi:MarR family